jgi:hypothetical protein
MRQAEISTLATEGYFTARARRADPAKVARILKRLDTPSEFHRGILVERNDYEHR